MTRNPSFPFSGTCKYLQVRNTRAYQRRGGFSLIEIAVALAIFVFGALAIVRIFPRALNVVQNSEQRAVGQRMAQSTLAQYQNNPLSVPDAIIEFETTYVSGSNRYGWSDFPGSVFGTRNINDSLPSDPATEGDLTGATTSPIKQTSLGRFRRIVGESHLIGKNGEVLLRFPYFPNTPTVTTNVVGKVRQEVEGVVLDAAGQLDFTNAHLRGITAAFNDASAGYPRRPPTDHRIGATQERTFRISYNWRDAGGNHFTSDEPKLFPDNTSPWLGGDEARPLQLSSLAPGPRTANGGEVSIWFYDPFPADPLPTSVMGDGNLDPALGRLLFAPADAGKRIYVDYTVRDWRALVVDTTLSTRLNDDDGTYLADNGIATTPVQARQVVVPTRHITDENVQVLTLLSGTINNGGTYQKSNTIRNAWNPDNTVTADPNAPATQTSKAIAVKPKTGQVFFDIKYTDATVTPNTQTLASPFARVVYRNVDGWAQQVDLAARSYLPYVPGSGTNVSFPREGWREYVGNGTGVMIFHASEAGKTFEVSYTYTESGVTRTMKNVQVIAERETQLATDFPPPTGFLQNYKKADGTNATSDRVAIAYLPDANGLKIGAPISDGGVTGTINSIQSLRGTSLRVRSAWYEGNGYTQTSVVGYRPLDVESWARN